MSVTTNGRGEAFATVLANGVGGFTRRPDGNWNRWSGDDGDAGIGNASVNDRHGNTTVVWAEGGECGGFDNETSWEDEPFRIEAAYRPAGKRFRPVSLDWESETCTGEGPELAVDATGKVTTLFQDGDRILATQRAAGTAWAEPVLMARGDRYEVAIGPAGAPVAVWTTRDGAVMSPSRTRGGAWSDPELISSADDLWDIEGFVDLELVRQMDPFERCGSSDWTGPALTGCAAPPSRSIGDGARPGSSPSPMTESRLTASTGLWRLTLRGVGARQVSLVARTCPGCGVVTVTHAGQRLGRIDLSSSRVRDRRVFRLKPRARLIRGPDVVRVVSRGKPVQIDSLIARP